MSLVKRAVNKFWREAISLQATLAGDRLRSRIADDLSRKSVTTIPISDGIIKFSTPSTPLIERVESLMTKEEDTIEWINNFAENSVLWDVGANVGVYSLYAAIRRHATVLAFEPLAANYYILNRNIQLNQLGNNIHAYCVAFSEKTMVGVLNSPSPDMGSAVNNFGEAGERSRYTQGAFDPFTQGMVGFSLDDFIRYFNPDFPNHIKIDVDGIEVPILQGARQTLRDSRLQSVLVELSLTHESETSDAIILLKEAGFEFAGRGAIQGNANEKAANHYFIRRTQ